MPSSPSVPATPVATPAEPHSGLTALAAYELAPNVWDGPVTLAQYFMGRDKNPAYAREVTPTLLFNAEETVRRVNMLLAAMRTGGVVIESKAAEWNTGVVAGRTPINSGWRPYAVNLGVPGAAARSLHISAQACDLFDPDGVLDDWCMVHLVTLTHIGLWLEHPAATKGWCHVQTVAPRSGNRVFYP